MKKINLMIGIFSFTLLGQSALASSKIRLASGQFVDIDGTQVSPG